MWGGAEMPCLCIDVSCGLCIVAGAFCGNVGRKRWVVFVCWFFVFGLRCGIVMVLWFGCVGCDALQGWWDE